MFAAVDQFNEEKQEKKFKEKLAALAKKEAWDKTVRIWDSTSGKEVSVLVCHCPIVCCCVECSDLRVWSMSRSAR